MVISKESRIWSSLGTEPAAGDEIYTAGEQPIASYDNWAMWAVTKDIDALDAALGDHNARHEVGGGDQLNLQNLQVSDVVALNGDSASGEFRLVNPDTAQSVARLDVDDGLIRQWPAFNVRTTHAQGLDLGSTLRRAGDNVVLYDPTLGAAGKFHHAQDADHAATADYAADSDLLDGYDSTDFLRPDQASATITGNWTYNFAIDADITGNAATADHADEADHATLADTATYATDSDMVDGYHAQDLIDMFAGAAANWQPVAAYEQTGVGLLNWQFQSPTTYDRYKFVIYHEAHHDYGSPAAHLRLRVGRNGTVDWRTRYKYRSMDWEPPNDVNPVNWHQIRDHFQLAQCPPHQFTVTTYTLSCPRQSGSVDKHYPSIAAHANEGHMDADCWFMFGSLNTSYPTINTWRFESTFTHFTGRIEVYGQDL